jgi:hypothetical protein
VFDPATAEAARDHGRTPERVRTWRGAERSVHPEASMVAVGPLARALTAAHPQQDAYGPDSPLGRGRRADPRRAARDAHDRGSDRPAPELVRFGVDWIDQRFT